MVNGLKTKVGIFTLSVNIPTLVGRKRRATGLRSPLAFVPESVLIPSEIDGVPVYMHEHVVEVQRRPGPSTPQWKIPQSEWPAVLRRVEQGETLRQIASYYGVSYEAVRRVVRASQTQGNRYH